MIYHPALLWSLIPLLLFILLLLFFRRLLGLRTLLLLRRSRVRGRLRSLLRLRSLWPVIARLIRPGLISCGLINPRLLRWASIRLRGGRKIVTRRRLTSIWLWTIVGLRSRPIRRRWLIYARLIRTRLIRVRTVIRLRRWWTIVPRRRIVWQIVRRIRLHSIIRSRRIHVRTVVRLRCRRPVIS